MTDIIIHILPDGTVRALHDDRLAGLYQRASQVHIRRVSYVEPTEDGQWTADMAPVGGGVLGPFRLRGEALNAEREWLHQHHGL